MLLGVYVTAAAGKLLPHCYHEDTARNDETRAGARVPSNRGAQI
jgi:hypothetical protein